MSDSNVANDRTIARRLPRAWPAFFASFGRLTAVQRASIPKILEGVDLLISSATASGKTEAVCAPLLERNIDAREEWTVLYVCPTRALVNDLYERLVEPARRLNLRLARRTGDHRDPLSTIPNVLLTTPESFDSLLARGRRPLPMGHCLARVVAVVLDEVHLVSGSARGEQLRWLIERLRRLRRDAVVSGWIGDQSIQVCGLSATVADPTATLQAFLPGGALIRVDDSREIEVVDTRCGPGVTEELLPAYLDSLAGPEKVLVFSNSRKRVDELSTSLRDRLMTTGYEVRAHHSSVDKNKREAVEEAVKTKDKIVVVATSTLELGVDIGDIDLVVLDGPPPNVPSLLQRIGRGNRRTQRTRVLPCTKSPVEEIIQSAMMGAARDGWLGPSEEGTHFAVVRQQIASFIFGYPRRAAPRDEIEDLILSCCRDRLGLAVLEGMLTNGELIEDQSGIRLGPEWLDKSAGGEIHSNIEDQPGIEVVDRSTGEKYVKGLRSQDGRGLHAGGFNLEVKKSDGYRLEVEQVKDPGDAPGEWSYASRPWLRGAAQPQCVRRYFQIAEEDWCVVHENGWTYAFHFGGAQRRAVVDLLALGTDVRDVKVNAWFLTIGGLEQEKPRWLEDPDQAVVEYSIPDRLNQLERVLARPYANRTLLDPVRIAEIRSWLRIDHQLMWIKKAGWKVLAEGEARTALREIISEFGGGQPRGRVRV